MQHWRALVLLGIIAGILGQGAAPTRAAPASLSISIATPSDVTARRDQLRSLIWPSGYPTSRRPDAVTAPGQPYDIWANMPNAADVTVFAVYQPHGVNVTGWYIRPKVSNGRSVIVHHGHDGGPLGSFGPNGWEAIHGRFVAYGFDTVVLTMPLMPPNPSLGMSHTGLEGFRTPTFHPFAYFLDPTIAALNFLKDRTGRSTATMTGLSGGGWTTTLAAAIEPRILKSYPVAGSLPLDIRTSGGEMGDYEQHDAEVYGLASYEDLYILGSVGSGRGQIQILNQFDACCFAYAGRESQINAYVGPVHDRAAQLGGTYYLWVDQGQHGHTISSASLDIIMGDLGAAPLPTPTPTMTPTRTPTPFVLPPTPTPLVLPTRQPTSTPVPAGSCSPRPPVKVQTTAIAGGIRVDVTAPTPIRSVPFGQVQNATLSPVSVVGNAATFTAMRQVPGAIHVPFTVVDQCGAWPTFAGSGS